MGPGDANRQGTPHRPALNNVDPNVYSNTINPGYGMSAGVKMGRQQNGPIGRPSGMSRPSGYVGQTSLNHR